MMPCRIDIAQQRWGKRVEAGALAPAYGLHHKTARQMPVPTAQAGDCGFQQQSTSPSTAIPQGVSLGLPAWPAHGLAYGKQVLTVVDARPEDADKAHAHESQFDHHAMCALLVARQR